MPAPVFAGDDDPLAVPDARLELLGRGKRSRATKTNIPDIEAATILQRIGNMPRDLADILQRLHAHHYTRTVTEKDENGKVTTRVEPEVLTYEELRKRYSCIRSWEEAHQGQVDHLVSVKGFSVIRATGGSEVAGARKDTERPDSSAGADTKKERWR